MLDTLRRSFRDAKRSDPARWLKWQMIKAVHAVAPEAGNDVGGYDEAYAAPSGAPFELKGRYGLVHGLLAPGDSVLEVGCGRGEFVRHLHGEGRRVMGVDFSKVAIDALRADGVEADVHDLLGPDPLPQGYDVVVCLEVLEHFREPWRIYEKLWQAAGKRVVFSVPDRFKVPDWNHLHEFTHRSVVDALSRYGVVGFVGGHPMYIIGTQEKR